MQALPSYVYAVILAGGSGTRFWPKSRHRLPKQLCKIGDASQTMIELTLARLDGLIPPERRVIITHKDQLALTREIVRDRCRHFIAEPLSKNTAPALTLAALEVQSLARSEGHSQGLILSLHADALIQHVDTFQQALKRMHIAAEEGYLTLLGVSPTYPETGYGYIEQGPELENLKQTYQVRSFREKPDKETAEHYLKKACFLWNSGIFAWRTDVILAELERFVPTNTAILTQTLQDTGMSSFHQLPANNLEEAYQQLQSIAIDPAVLERSQKVAVIAADIGWKDVGSWDALDQCFPTDQKGNLLLSKDVISIDNERITIDSDAKIIACIGLRDLVIVSSNGAILVCKKDRAQDVKRIVEDLKQSGRSDLI